MSRLDWGFRTVIEPFRVKAVEPIPILDRRSRERALRQAGYNLFRVKSRNVTIDLLTDSGTGALSAEQWGALLVGDESYAGSRSFERFEAVFHNLAGYRHIFPVHQGRAAERILAKTVLMPGQWTLNNTHFDTTRANFEQAGAIAIDLPDPGASEPGRVDPFKGNMNLEGLERTLASDRDRVGLVMLTMTNNAVGGQPVSMDNIEQVSQLCRRAQVPFFLDAARFAENAWFIHTREPGYGNWSLMDIARKAFRLADGCTLSAKKDGIVHIGGILATDRDDWAEKFRNELILGEGFTSYGGLAGRDLESMSVGLEESLDKEYLRYRVQSMAYFAEGLEKVGIPVVKPPGGHAVFIDAGSLLDHIPPESFPGHALACEFYLVGGIRGVEVGSLMFPGSELELLRLAVPRRVYTQSHIDYVIEVGEKIAKSASLVPPYRIVEEPPFLRHFSAVLEPVRPASRPETLTAGQTQSR